MSLRRPTHVAGWLAALALLFTGVLHAAGQPTDLRPGADQVQLRQQGLDLAYNLDHDQGIALLRRAVTMNPDDPASHRTLASVLWLHILFRRGAVTVDHYLGSFSRAHVDLPKPDPEVDAEFRTHVAKAIALGERRVAAAPRDPQARYDLGAAVGLQASYMATVEGRMLAGFKAARRSYNEHERVLALDSSRRDAGLIVGTYRYVVSTLSLPMRLMAYVAGFGGGRSEGIQALESAATSASEARTEAMFALILVYNRERRFEDALRITSELRRMYPRDRLVLLEAGATALRGGKGQLSEDLLTEGLAMLARDTRRRIPGEEALWRYKRGAARAALGKTELALADLRSATSGDTQSWVHGRARVELGRLALSRGDRVSASTEAREAQRLCLSANDPACVDDARTLSRRSDGR